MQKVIGIICISFFFNCAIAQDFLPTDYLSKEFHKERREALRKLMPPNSVTVIFSYPEQIFSKDVNYIYHPNPDLYYFSGYKEPDAVLFIFKENQQRGDTSFNELFFVRKRDASVEQWTGRRLGVEGVQKQLGFKVVYNSSDFKNYPLDLTKYDKVIFDNIPDENAPGMLKSLVKSFKEKSHLKFDNANLSTAFYVIANLTTPKNVVARANRFRTRMAESDEIEFKTNPILLEFVNHPDSVTLYSTIKKINDNPLPSSAFDTLVSSLREVKTKEELNLLRKSVFISAIAHSQAMKAIKPTISESELEGIFLYVHKKYGAEDEGYPPIVGAGANGCILHYEENNSTKVNNQLVLMDVAAEYHGYSADITRTVPANGKFSPEQKKKYQLVYEAQEEIFKLCKEGTPFKNLNDKAIETLASGLLKLGILKDAKDIARYYPHGCSHHMGLDVHDKSVTPILKENMVITVETGIYIPKGSPCDPKWWNIGVRIEDDVIIGKNNCEIMSAYAPRKLKDVENITSQKSVLNNFILPPIASLK